ncbi:MAG: DNA polymerase III subunit delta [Candidatus Moranbacteria bacterium]|nr:DNA polymerase III subunit delta [Candidatus Moranbacteria bacterium]
MIIFLYGEDAFRSRQKLDELKNRFLTKYGAQASLSVVDAEENREVRLADLINSPGLFSSIYLVIIKNLISELGKDQQVEILNLLRSKKSLLGSKDIVLIFWEKEIPNAKSVLFQFLKKNAQTQKFAKLEGASLARWMLDQLKELNPALEISRKVLEKIAAYTGNDLFQISSEFKKLASFREKGKITEEDVDFLVTSKININIFDTIEAASEGNKKKALKLLHQQLQSGEDPFYVFSMYIYQFRNLLKIGELHWQGVAEKHKLAKITKLHPFVVQKTLPQLKNFTLQKLKNIYQKLQKTDEELKTGRAEDIQVELDRLIMEI